MGFSNFTREYLLKFCLMEFILIPENLQNVNQLLPVSGSCMAEKGGNNDRHSGEGGCGEGKVVPEIIYGPWSWHSVVRTIASEQWECSYPPCNAVLSKRCCFLNGKFCYIDICPAWFWELFLPFHIGISCIELPVHIFLNELSGRNAGIIVYHYKGWPSAEGQTKGRVLYWGQ